MTAAASAGEMEVTGLIKTDTLLERFVKNIKLPWSVFTLIVAVFLIIMLAITAFADGLELQQLGWNFWRDSLQGPAILVYILCIYQVLQRVGNNALESILPLLSTEIIEKKQYVSKYYSPRRSREWLAIFLGIVFVFLLSQPWQGGDFHFFNSYLYFVQILMFSLLALLIYYSLLNTRLITKINQNLKIDVFETEALIPIARWSLGISLAFIGGIVISIVLQDIENLIQWQVIVIYAILVATTVGVFFMSMWSAHSAIIRVKKTELDSIRQKIINSYNLLKQNNHKNEANNITLYNEVAALGLFEKQIREVKEWPYSTSILSRLVLSIVSPIVVYVIKFLWDLYFGF
jgi:hypothetical protein